MSAETVYTIRASGRAWAICRYVAGRWETVADGIATLLLALSLLSDCKAGEKKP